MDVAAGWAACTGMDGVCCRGLCVPWHGWCMLLAQGWMVCALGALCAVGMDGVCSVSSLAWRVLEQPWQGLQALLWLRVLCQGSPGSDAKHRAQSGLAEALGAARPP